MTYCVGMLLEKGLVMLSDSRTNAGIDHINTFRKMTYFEEPEERVFTSSHARAWELVRKWSPNSFLA